MTKRRPRSLALIATLGVVMAAAPSWAGDDAPSRTRIVVVQPVTSSGIAPGYRVTVTKRGECGQPSGVANGRSYRCGVGRNGVIDACWADPASGRPTALCIGADPFRHALWRLRLTKPPSHVNAGPIPLNSPWAMVLASGERCINSGYSTGTFFRGHQINYYCSGRTLLENRIDRTRQPWVGTKVIHRHGDQVESSVAVATAVYGTSAGTPLSPALPYTGLQGFLLMLVLGAASVAAGSWLLWATATPRTRLP